MTTAYAYTTTRPEIVDAVRAAQEAMTAWNDRLITALGAIVGRPRHLTGHNALGTPRFIGLSSAGPEDTLPGWTYSKRYRCLVPPRGKAGIAARTWLEEYATPPETPLRVIGEHGAPRITDRPVQGRYEINLAKIALVADVVGSAVHVLYAGDPTVPRASGDLWDTVATIDTTRWTREPLPAYYAAIETLNEVPA